MTFDPREFTGLKRREFLKYLSLAAIAACGGQGGGASTTLGASTTAGTSPVSGPTTMVGAPASQFTDPTVPLSGDLRILLWSHFVPAHDTWFDPFVREWGEQVGINVTVDHINVADIPARISSEISAEEGHDLIQYIAPLSQFEPSVVDMTDVTEEAVSRWGEQLSLSQRSSFNPNTEKYYAYSPGWVPDPGDFRGSLWEAVGLPDGPTTWDELLEGGSSIFSDQGVQLGIGMSQEIDSNMAGRALLWSFGGSIQDENENVTINSQETVDAVAYMKELYSGAMTDEVFAWTAASNNQGLISGELSYILNSISAYRTSQEANPEVADDTFFSAALSGPAAQLVASHVMYNWIVPNHAQNVDAAKEFLLHYTLNYESACWHSQLYDFPAFAERVPDLETWVSTDPFGSQPADKLSVLSTALDWSTNVGHPGPANPATGQIFGESIIPVMYAEAARGDKTPEEAVADAETKIKAIYADWRERGLVGGET
ncbi:MAG TPA: extracellular solute-binding protein [Acidimicrobiia bacterium]|nr:extracellular solute-binding protein [Acidimicrobiia bacterium]